MRSRQAAPPPATPAAPGASGPLQAVLAAFRSGAGTVDEIAAGCGLTRDVVDAALEYLIRSGRLAAQPLAGCPIDGCGGCPAGPAGAWCAAALSGRRPGPVLLTLRG